MSDYVSYNNVRFQQTETFDWVRDNLNARPLPCKSNFSIKPVP